MNPKEHGGKKAGLIIAALVVGIAVFILLCIQTIPATESVNIGSFFSPVYVDHPTTTLSVWHRSGEFITLSALAGIAASFLYVLLAAGGAEVFIELRSWAYCGHAERPGDDEVLAIGTWWPFALFGGCLIYLFIGVINRSFH